MFQNMGPTPAGRSGHAMASIGSKIYLVGGESFAPTKGEDSNVIHVLDTSKNIPSFYALCLNIYLKTEHIKYPDPSKSQNSAQPITQQQQQGGSVTRKSSATPQGQGSISIAAGMNPSEIRSMSPVPGQQQPAEEEIRRAMSPSNVVRQSIKPTNGITPSPFPGGVNGKAKIPTRPPRPQDDVDDNGTTESGTNESFPRERAASPDQGPRAKSPGSRAVSPTNGIDGYPTQPNMMAVSMGMTGRSSPAVDGMPAVNGFGHGSRGGSGNVTADLVRDLKSKEIELETVRRQMLWMKEALGKATRSGYVYVDRDGHQDLDETFDDESDRRYTDLVMKFKQFKGQMQVRYRLCN
jgi:hypothetical protein